MVHLFADLAVELLEQCFHPLPCNDLCNVVLVCRAFADVGRTLLYRTVVFRSDMRHIQHTISLIRRTRGLSVKILRAILTTVPPFKESPWIPPDLLKESVNLNMLELRGFPFIRLDDQRYFHDALWKCRKLTNFTYRPGAMKFPESGFELAGLKCITWHNSLGTTDQNFLHVLTASSQSLTKISFEGMVVHREKQPYGLFLHLQFPNLSSLRLGSLIQTYVQDRANESITKFILNHPGIEHLSLGTRRYNDMFFEFRHPLLTPDSLPLMRSFEGFPENVITLAHRGVKSLFNLTSLALFCPAGNDFREVKDMIDAIKHPLHAPHTVRRLSELKHLGLNLDLQLTHRMPSNMTPLIPRNLMAQLSDICPAVSTYRGRLYPMPAKAFGHMFGTYEHLEVISLPGLAFLFVGPEPLVFFQLVAEKCRRLTHVIQRRPSYTEFGHTIYTLRRDAHGGLIGVDVREMRSCDITSDFDDLNDPSLPRALF